DDQTQSPLLFLGREGALLVAGRQPGPLRENPDLQEVHEGTGGVIELTMSDSRAGAHALDFSWSDDCTRAEAVFVLQSTLQGVRNDLHVAVRMRPKPCAGLHAIFVDHAQRPETRVPHVIIVRKGEGVITL